MRIFADPRRGVAGTYRLYSAEGALLYVGVGVSPGGRVQTHRHRQPWGPEIAVVVIDWWPSERVAHLAERQTIRDERPLHNVIRYAQ